MLISKLRLENYKCFEDSGDITFHSNMNVIVGINGSGKSSILKACRSVLSWFLYDFREGKFAKISNDEFRTIYRAQGFEYAPFSRISYIVEFDKNEKSKSESIMGTRERLGFTKETIPQTRNDFLRLKGQEFLNSLQNESTSFPILSYHGTARLHSESNRTLKATEKREKGSRLNTYLRCLDNSSSYFLSCEWFRDLYRKNASNTIDNIGYSTFGLDVVHKVFQLTFNDLDVVFWHEDYEDVAIRFASGYILPFKTLSDGFQNLCKLLLDLCYRACSANPQMAERANESEGIVLIDEIDLHLHPGLQRRIIPILQNTFPNIQFILTTHSPQVISSVKSENLLLLKDGKVEKGEQKRICCYCNEKLIDGMITIEHFRTQKEDNTRPVPLNLHYSNLYASRNKNYSCNLKRGDDNITDFIRKKDCESNFTYSQNKGIEIKCKDETDKTIETLGLNNTHLKTNRKKALDDFLRVLRNFNFRGRIDNIPNHSFSHYPGMFRYYSKPPLNR